MRTKVAVALWLFAVAGSAQVLDRVAVVVGKDVITESEVLEEVLITAFLNGEKPVFTTDSKRAAADRLVDQLLIKREISASGYPPPAQERVNAYFEQFRKGRFANDSGLQRALHEYGLTEAELQRHLAWQVSVLQFTGARFGQAGSDVDRELESWLKNVRDQTKVEFKKETFS